MATDDWRRRYAIEADGSEVIVACAQCGPVLSAGRRVALAELVAHARWHESHDHAAPLFFPCQYCGALYWPGGDCATCLTLAAWRRAPSSNSDRSPRRVAPDQADREAHDHAPPVKD